MSSTVDPTPDGGDSEAHKDTMEGEPPKEESNYQAEAASRQEPYSLFSTRDKWLIIALTAVAGILSPLTANVYFPALPILADAFHTTQERMNLTVTLYMIFQGVSPMLWGPLADRSGRRPIYMACLLTLCISCIGLALVPTNAYWLLMLLRCFQAAGSASTIALGAGVIVDVASREERGIMYGAFIIGPMVGPCIGPVLGGVLSEKLGWRSIFWFLAIVSGAVVILMFLVLPETLRALVGNGSTPPSRFNRPIVPLIHLPLDETKTATTVRLQIPNPFRLLIYPNIILVLFINGLFNSVFYAMSIVIATTFQDKYPFLNQAKLGLCFLPIGIGFGFGSIVTGRLIDRDYARIMGRWEKEGKAKEDFPIEHTRLRTGWVYLTITLLSSAGFGWATEEAVNIAVPLLMTFLAGWACIALMNIHQTLLMDLYPAKGSSVMAANNLVRCTMGAVTVSVVEPMLNALNIGRTFVILVGIATLSYPSVWALIHFGPRWRRKEEATTAETTQERQLNSPSSTDESGPSATK